MHNFNQVRMGPISTISISISPGFLVDIDALDDDSTGWVFKIDPDALKYTEIGGESYKHILIYSSYKEVQHLGDKDSCILDILVKFRVFIPSNMIDLKNPEEFAEGCILYPTGVSVWTHIRNASLGASSTFSKPILLSTDPPDNVSFQFFYKDQ